MEISLLIKVLKWNVNCLNSPLGFMSLLSVIRLLLEHSPVANTFINQSDLNNKKTRQDCILRHVKKHIHSMLRFVVLLFQHCF